MQHSIFAILIAITASTLMCAAASTPMLAQAITADRPSLSEQKNAQEAPAPDQRRSMLGNRAPKENRVPSQAEPGLMDKAWAWLMRQQQNANRRIVGAVKDLKSDANPATGFVLIALSFLYGVLHAAGPGHGKAVISSYVLANERTVRRGILLSFLAAFFQAISAIVIISVLVIFMKATSFQIKGAEHWITTLSWGLIALLGAWLLYGQLRVLWRAWQARRQNQADRSHHENCDHHHDHGQHAADGTCCGHAHMPDAQAVSDNFTWRKGLLIAGSVGIRPCTGALLVLIFALTNGLLWAGIAATFAMALGTAITVSVLAAAAVGTRTALTRIAGGESRWAWRIERAAGVLGSFLVFSLGASFFAASLLAPASPF